MYFRSPDTDEFQVIGGGFGIGRGRIRTFEGISHQIYSPFRELSYTEPLAKLKRVVAHVASAAHSALVWPLVLCLVVAVNWTAIPGAGAAHTGTAKMPASVREDAGSSATHAGLAAAPRGHGLVLGCEQLSRYVRRRGRYAALAALCARMGTSDHCAVRERIRAYRGWAEDLGIEIPERYVLTAPGHTRKAFERAVASALAATVGADKVDLFLIVPDGGTSARPELGRRRIEQRGTTLFITRPQSQLPPRPVSTAPSQAPARPPKARKKAPRKNTDPILTAGRVNVIYCRYSSELQRVESISDQERRCREHLRRLDIPDEGFIVLADEAISGALESRPQFDRLKELVYSKRLGIVVVTEQSRLSRGDNAKALIKDMVFHGGRGRGPKPKRVVVIDDAAAAMVRQVFRMFAVEGRSMNEIVRWWNQHLAEFPPITRKSSAKVRIDHVRRTLKNRKYIGTWIFGATTTVYDGHGNGKAVPARPDQTVTVVERPALRIIDQATWEKAQARFIELKAIYGMKPDGRRRGPAVHYRRLYDRSLLGGKVTCACCGSTLLVAARLGEKRSSLPSSAAVARMVLWMNNGLSPAADRESS